MSKLQKRDGKISKSDVFNDLEKHIPNPNYSFPIEVFHPKIRAIITELWEKIKFHPDYISCGILVAISVAIGKKHVIRKYDTWKIMCNLYMVVIGLPGDAKTPAIDFCMKPIEDKQRQYFEEYKKALSEYNELEDKKTGIEPNQIKILLNDYTPEFLYRALHKNDHGVCVYTDELIGWFKKFNRYNNGGENELYLSLWSGKTIPVDRLTRESYFVERPKVDVIGTIQTTILNLLNSDSRKENGFVYRLLFSFPSNTETIKWSTKDVEISSTSYYSQFINKILDNAELIEYQKEIEFSEEAHQHLVNWQNQLPEDFAFEYERGVQIKLQEYVLRFCLILQIMDDTVEDRETTFINVKAVKSAIKLFDYFQNTAHQVFDRTQTDYFDTLNENQQVLYQRLSVKFTQKDAQEIVTTVLGKSERTAYRMLNDTKLYKKISRGSYRKIYFESDSYDTSVTNCKNKQD